MTIAARTLTDHERIEYPETDHMPNSLFHFLVGNLLFELLRRYTGQLADGTIRSEAVAPAGGGAEQWFVGADQFWYYTRGATAERVAPDVYVLPNVPANGMPRSLQLWELAAPPLVAIEVVSTTPNKDYLENPAIYQRTNVGELIVFDPEAPKTATSPRSLLKERVCWQVWRRNERGELRAVQSNNNDRVFCQTLGCWLRVVGAGDERRIRLGIGPNGDELFATEAEAQALNAAIERKEKLRQQSEKERALELAEHERSEKERERSEKEHERSEKERERSEKERERAVRLELEAKLEALLNEKK